MSEEFIIWTIYARPLDMPDQAFVARGHAIRSGGTFPLEAFETGGTLAEIRAKLPPGLTLIPRGPDDDPVIVESWV